MNDNNEKQETAQSPERRKLLKKAAWVAPTVVVLGVAAPLEKAFADSFGGTPPSDPPVRFLLDK